MRLFGRTFRTEPVKRVFLSLLSLVSDLVVRVEDVEDERGRIRYHSHIYSVLNMSPIGNAGLEYVLFELVNHCQTPNPKGHMPEQINRIYNVASENESPFTACCRALTINVQVISNSVHPGTSTLCFGER